MRIARVPEHLKRYKEIARIFIKYGRSDLLSGSGLDAILDGEIHGHTNGTEPQAEALARDLEEMGPLFIKLGQLLSSRADLLPPAYLQALARLQDNLEPFSFADVEEIVQDDIGVRMSKAFTEFEAFPFAAASLGQVHRAALHDGRAVAVKVQRPGIRKQIAQDLEIMDEIAGFIDAHTEMGRRYRFGDLVDEFRKDLARELDYRQEARNLIQVGENLRMFSRIVVPKPIHDYSSARVLTMEYIHGRNINALGPLAHLEMKTGALAEELFRAYLQQILVDGIFHADPHPGNILVTDDGRIALVDMGMVGYLSSKMQEHLLKLLIAVSEGRTDEAADQAIKIGETTESFDEAEFRRRVAEIIAKQRNATVEQMQIGRAMLEFTRTTGESGIRMPSELAMFSKTLLNLDEAGRILDPAFDPNQAIRRNAVDMTRQRVYKSLTPGRLFSAAMEAKEIAEEMPGRVNKILDALSKNELEFRIQAIDEATLIEGFQKVANRITMGLVLAALIVGAAMLMRVDTKFRILGYPGLAMLCFLAAAGGGFALVVLILINDRDARRRTR